MSFLASYSSCPNKQNLEAALYVVRHCPQNINFNPLATPYRSGCPINCVPSAIIDEDDNLFVKRRDAYQSLVG